MSTPSPRFLLDENVRIELAHFLRKRGFNVKTAIPSTPDSFLAMRSKKDKRIFVTNDWDFLEYTKDKIFAVIWLRIPQNDSGALVASFEKLIDHAPSFSGRLFILRVKDWEDLPLATSSEFRARAKKPS